MKLGVSINLFDGVELLPYQVKYLRKQVDYIHVCYQEISNNGEVILEGIGRAVKALKSLGLVDSFTHYVPSANRPPAWCELTKRNRGLFETTAAGMTHHMSLDCDEFFMPAKLQWLKQQVEEKDLDSCSCRLITYYKKPTQRLDTWDVAYLPLIYKIREGVCYEFQEYPVLVDPTRRMSPGKHEAFEPDEIFCHHYSYVRENIHTKLMCSTARDDNFKDRIPELVDYFISHNFPDKALIAGSKDEYYELIETPNFFGIEI